MTFDALSCVSGGLMHYWVHQKDKERKERVVLIPTQGQLFNMMHTAVHHPKGLSETILFHALVCASNDMILELHRAVAHALLDNNEAHTSIPRHDGRRCRRDCCRWIIAWHRHQGELAMATTRRHGTLQGITSK